jgi:TPP-dependent indolepyruvate ferredoxin oxidoreductase alpha subunit
MASPVTLKLGRVRLSGSQSIVRGALEAGVQVATAYPGAPISELEGTFEQLAGKAIRTSPFTQTVGESLEPLRYRLTAVWGETTNEPNASAFAVGAVICKGDSKVTEFLTPEEWQLIWGDTVWGREGDPGCIPVGPRAMCSFKHLGGSTAADTIRTQMNITPYTGGLAFACGDDRQGTASQTMQDNKVLFAFHFRMPTFEVHSPRSAHLVVRHGYRLFEELGLPFAVILNYELSYREQDVHLEMPIDLAANHRQSGFLKDPKYLVTIGPHIRPREERYWQQILPLVKRKVSEHFAALNSEVKSWSDRCRHLLVLNGPYREAYYRLDQDPALLEQFRAKYREPLVLLTDLVFPLPEPFLLELFQNHPFEEITVLEEGYSRAIYLQLLDLVNLQGLGLKVHYRGTPYEPRLYERVSYVERIIS